MDLTLLINAGILHANETLQANSGNLIVTAHITVEGKILIDGQPYDNAEDAMLAVLGSSNTNASNSPATSSGLQFWSWWNQERLAWAPLEHARAEFEQLSQSQSIKTSDTHPLRFDYVSPLGCTGRIGMTVCPGKKGSGLYGGNWQRDLTTDLQQIKDWGATTLISLMEAHEFDLLEVPEFIHTLRETPIDWYHLPIKDMHPPGEAFEQAWSIVADQFFEQLRQGQDIVIHCRGGLGRTGLLAARILVEMGEAPESAIKRVRAAREHAIETYAQEQYVLEQSWC